MPTGTLYLIPTPLADGDVLGVLPMTALERVRALTAFIVEEPKTARAILRAAGYPRPIGEARMAQLDVNTSPDRLGALLQPLLEGTDIGLLSEAGAPAVADPGAALVRLAHAAGVRVVPLVGPSAILLALMASGLDGQRFAFRGYLPVDESQLKAQLKTLEADSRRRHETQIFIETPYRNDRLMRAVLSTCGPRTLLCVATELTGAGESVRTATIESWRSDTPDIGKRPTVFLLLALSGG